MEQVTNDYYYNECKKLIQFWALNQTLDDSSKSKLFDLYHSLTKENALETYNVVKNINRSIILQMHHQHTDFMFINGAMIGFTGLACLGGGYLLEMLSDKNDPEPLNKIPRTIKYVGFGLTFIGAIAILSAGH